MIEGQLLATVFICRKQGQQLSGTSRSNQMQPYLPMRLSTKQSQQRLKRLYICAHLHHEVGVVIDEPTAIKEDNQSCIKMCKNPVM